jgi:hypothetical protein
MNLTIALDESQAAQLQSQASSRHLSPEQFARVLLGEALGRMVAEQKWDAVNRRRGELIRQSRSSGLSAAETAELDQLQAAVDGRLEPMDRQLLAAAEHLRQRVEGLPDESPP